MSDTSEDERKNRAARGHRLYLVFMEAVEGSGDRSAARADHFAFVADLEAQGVLFAGGPFINEETQKTTGSGMLVLRGNSAAEVEAIVRNDPFVAGGFRSYTIQPWRLNEGRLGLDISFSGGGWSFSALPGKGA